MSYKYYGCTCLTSMTIPNSVTTIGDRIFSNCTNLSNISVESGNGTYDSRDNCNAIIETASNTLIAGCKNTVIPNSIVRIGGGAFFFCTSLTSISIPGSVTIIDSNAFVECSSLTSLTIPNSVTTIGEFAFSQCYHLTSVTLPYSLTSIGYDAFGWCNSLTSVTVGMTTPVAISDFTFTSRARANATLYVPAGCKAAYEAADYWKDFKTIEELPEPEIAVPFDVNGDGEVNSADITCLVNRITGITSCPNDHHPHLIDLGLPSGTKWACCNLDATTPEGYGGYYRWGETSPLTIEETPAAYPYGGVYLGDIISGTQYDAATVDWGASWVMPTKGQMDELLEKCTHSWTTQNGVNGRKFTGPNGGTIFIPAAGFWDNKLYNVGTWASYWSSTPFESSNHDSHYLSFSSSSTNEIFSTRRYYARSVRPVQIANSPEESQSSPYDVNQDGEVNIADVTLLIDRIAYLERLKTLESGSAEEVRTVLEEMSGTRQTNASEVATVLKDNPNVEEAYTADGAYLAVKTTDSDNYVFYPMYDTTPLFSDVNLPARLARLVGRPKRVAGNMGKIAIFNYYDGFDWYKTQNAVVEAIETLFKNHGYTVEYYGDGSISGHQDYYPGNLNDVVEHSDQYKAIILMGHGTARWTDVNDYDQRPEYNTANMSRHVIATRWQTIDNNCAIREAADRNYYLMMDCELKVKGDCILYDGTCDGAPTSGFSTNDDEYPNVSQSVVLGWNGVNRMSQAHALLLFNRMLTEGWSLKDAVALTFKKDETYGSFYLVKDSYDPVEEWYDRDYSELMCSKWVGNQRLSGSSELVRHFHPEANITFMDAQYHTVGDHMVKDSETGQDGEWIYGRVYGDLGDRAVFKVQYLTLYGSGSKEKLVFSTKESDGSYKLMEYLPLRSEGIYQVVVSTLNFNQTSQLPDQWLVLQTAQPLSVIYSGVFKDNCLVSPASDEETTSPMIINLQGDAVSDITLAAGSSATFTLNAYSGHTFETPCLDNNVATVSLSGSTLTVTGVSEGATYFGVYDVQNRQTAVVMVTVTPGTSLFSCPDDHHPHLIDLGLPSGTKWACCNVGASNPEEYGDYFAWGETTPKDEYNWSTYKWCKGSDDTMIKYCIESFYGYEGFTDNKTELELEDDAATANWGSGWRMPTSAQFWELINSDYTTTEWTTINGLDGRKITSTSNGNSIFLPAAGYRSDTSLSSAGSRGYYWARSLSTFNCNGANWLCFDSGYFFTNGNYRNCGQTVRPVRVQN